MYVLEHFMSLRRILIFISIQYQFNLHNQFFLIFFKTKLLMINLKIEHCGSFYDPSYQIQFLIKWQAFFTTSPK